MPAVSRPANSYPAWPWLYNSNSSTSDAFAIFICSSIDQDDYPYYLIYLVLNSPICVTDSSRHLCNPSLRYFDSCSSGFEGLCLVHHLRPLSAIQLNQLTYCKIIIMTIAHWQGHLETHSSPHFSDAKIHSAASIKVAIFEHPSYLPCCSVSLSSPDRAGAVNRIHQLARVYRLSRVHHLRWPYSSSAWTYFASIATEPSFAELSWPARFSTSVSGWRSGSSMFYQGFWRAACPLFILLDIIK